MSALALTIDFWLVKAIQRVNRIVASIVTLSDKDLIKEFSETKDAAIIGVFYDRYGHLVQGVCLKYLKDEELSKELTQEIFSGLFEKIAKNYAIDHFKHWLLTVARNECFTHFRKNKSLKKEQEAYTLIKKSEEYFVENNGFERLINDTQDEKLLLALNDALEKLSTTQKLCIEEFYFSNLSYKTIAKSHKLSIKEVKSSIQNGKRMLKQLMLKDI